MPDVAFPEWNNWVAGFLGYFPIYIQHDRSRFTSSHTQPGVEIHITHEGRANLFANARLMLQEPRQVAILDGAVPHQLITDASLPFERTVICVNLVKLSGWQPDGEVYLSDLYRTWANAGLNIHLTLAEFESVAELSCAMTRELQNKKTDWQLMILAQFTQLTVLLHRSAERGKTSSTAGAKLSDLAVSGARYVQEHLTGDLSLRNVAHILGVSPEHLTRTFQRDFGISFHRYVLLLRIEEAKRLLWSCPTMAITDIAFAVGFNSLSHFSQTFGRLTEQTPSAFRRRKA